MASKKKLLQAAAGAAGGAGLDIDDVFSTYLYTTDGTSSKTITNNIDLSGEGGLVWLKRRSGSYSHSLYDTERGVQKQLQSDATTAESTETGGLTAFTSTGFTIGNVQNQSALGDIVSWTFRKAPKFFDVVTYTGDGNDGRTISHNLGSTPGMIIVARRDSTNYWRTWHRSQTGKYANLYDTGAFASDSASNGVFNNYSGNDSTFTAGININANSATYVAYLFAHNDGNGDFGPDGDADIIKCGSFTTDSSGVVTVNLGFEPQWIFYKPTGTGGWVLLDVMRGITTDGTPDSYLIANNANAEAGSSAFFEVFSNGFKGTALSGSADHVYMAIRRGSLVEPTSATDVFDVNVYTSSGSAGNKQTTGFPVDLSLLGVRDGSSGWMHGVVSRLTGGDVYLSTSTDAVTASTGGYQQGLRLDDMTGFSFRGQPFNNNSGSNNMYNINWKRAPSFCDVVCYDGTGSARTVNHNLGVAPEMMWVKSRETVLSSNDWWVFHKDLSTPADDSLNLNTTGAENTGNGALLWNSTMPTSSVFSLGTYNGVNQSSKGYIAYLFATLDGISKVGSYTGNGSANHQIDCGFSSGARFVLIKRTDSSDGWKVHDSVRGIVAGNDPFVELNNTNAENSSFDLLDPYSGGFAVNNYAGWNASGGSYIFYAIA